MTEVKRIRLLAAGLFFAFLALVGTLISIPWLISDPLPVVRPESRMVFPADDALSTPVAAQMQVNAAGDFEFFVSMSSEDNRMSPPSVVFEMPEHEMAVVESEVDVIGAGNFRATGRLGMPGRWQVRIEDEADTHVFGFILAEF